MRKILLLFPVSLLLFSLVQAQQTPPSIVWQKCIGGSREDKAYAVARTKDNGFIVVGSSKSNDGDVSGHHGSIDSLDAWIAKISSTGDIEWQRSMGGTNNDVFTNILSTSDGGYLCAGTTMSKNGDVSGSHGREDIWLVKFNRNGAVEWSRCYGGSGTELIGNLKESADGFIYLIGTTYSNDGDVFGHHLTATPPPNLDADIWFLKLAYDGSIIKQKCFGGSIQADLGYDIVETADKGFLLAVEYNSDGDFGPGSGNPPRGYIVKVISDTVYVRKDLIQRERPLQISKLQGRYYINRDIITCYPTNPSAGTQVDTYTDGTGTGPNYSAGFSACSPIISQMTPFYRTTGPYSLGLSDNIAAVAITANDSTVIPGYRGGFSDGLVAGMKNGNGVVWKKFIGGSGADELVSANWLTETDLLVLGSTNSNNKDVSGNHGGYDIWLVKMGNINTISGKVFLDYNKNGAQDAGEPFMNGLLVQSEKSGLLSGSSTYDGLYSNSVDSGTYNTRVVSPVKYYTPVPATQTSSFASYGNVQNHSFALQPIPSQRDYSIYAFSTHFAVRPNGDLSYKIRLMNGGTDTLSNKDVFMVKDSRLTYVSASPSPTRISGDTIVWRISSVLPDDTLFTELNLKAGIPPALNLGDTVGNSFYIDSTGDLNASDNRFATREALRTSFDPNDKSESKSGKFLANDINAGQYLVYTVRFQNTGNDTAFNISVRDTLDAKLDYTTIETIASSHPYQLTTSNGNQLKWTFKNIKLADSVHNESFSHGYIVYRVKPLPGLKIGDSVQNSASIYFDFNAPVKTNTQITVIRDELVKLPKPVVSGMRRSYCQTEETVRAKITNLQPSNNLVKLDSTILSIAPDSSFSIDLSTLTPGDHVVTVTFGTVSNSSISTYPITVTAAKTPQVKLQTNKVEVSSNDVNVQVSAEPIAGAGNVPLFSFGWDRNMNRLIQAESESKTVVISTTSLAIGLNWIYVRMKSDDSCVTKPFATDSVSITLNAGKGLSDPDYPNSVIIAYPNPFAGIIHVAGLHTEKTYTLVLTNSNGQVVRRQQIVGVTEYTLSAKSVARGEYWLTVFDNTRNRKIGIIRLMRE